MGHNTHPCQRARSKIDSIETAGDLGAPTVPMFQSLCFFRFRIPVLQFVCVYPRHIGRRLPLPRRSAQEVKGAGSRRSFRMASRWPIAGQGAVNLGDRARRLRFSNHPREPNLSCWMKNGGRCCLWVCQGSTALLFLKLQAM